MDWNTINNKRKPFIRMGERLFGKMFNDIRRSLITEIAKVERVEQINGVIDRFGFDVPMQEAYEKFYVRTVMAFAKDFLKAYKSGRGPDETKIFGDIDEVLLANVLDFVRTKGGLRITSVMRTHYNDIELIARRAVETGIEQGLAFDKVARLINSEYANMAKWEALRIARTETVTASNYGEGLGAEQLPGNKVKVWISSFTPTSRDDHMAMDGVEVAPNEFFTLPDGTQLMYPGDTDGPADQVINCRCGVQTIITDEIF